MFYVISSNELYHHGILGQRWGIRRYQNPDGSLTEEGLKRYGDINQNNKSNHRIKLEQQYKSRGMSDEESVLSADGRIKAEKTLAVIGGIAVATAIAVAAYKQYNKRVDKIISDNKSIQSISKSSIKDPNNPFYGAVNKSDKIKYKGMFAGDHLKGLQGTDVYQHTLKAKGKIKVASEKNAIDTFKKLMDSDPEYKNALIKHLSKNKTLPDDLYEKVQKSIKKIDKPNYKVLYEAANHQLVDHTEVGNSLSSKLYSAFKKAGYGAIQDVNDKKYSGYGAKNPLIFFGGADSLLSESSSKLKITDIKKSRIHAYAMTLGQGIADGLIKNPKTYAFGGAAVAAGLGESQRIDRYNDSVVKKYREEHPNSNMSYYQILASKGIH